MTIRNGKSTVNPDVHEMYDLSIMGCYNLGNALQAFLPVIYHHSERHILLYKTRQNRQGTIIKEILFLNTLGSKLGKEILRRNSVALYFLRSTVGPRRLIIVIVGKNIRDLRRKA